MAGRRERERGKEEEEERAKRLFFPFRCRGPGGKRTRKRNKLFSLFGLLKKSSKTFFFFSSGGEIGGNGFCSLGGKKRSDGGEKLCHRLPFLLSHSLQESGSNVLQ